VKQAIALLVVLSWTTPAAHAAPNPPSPVDHYQVGKQLFEQKRYAQALVEFRQALALTPRPEVLYSMAQTQRLLGDCASAIDTYRAFLAARPGEPLAGYAHANIERCERDAALAREADASAWYRDVAGDLLVGGGVIAGATGVVIWHSGRGAAMNLGEATDYQTFLARQSAAASALTEQQLGVAAMIVGGAAIVGGVVHYVHRARSSRREPSLGVALTPGGAVIAGRGTF
jgi:tetratricopeptide (TPR) repeat protein